MSNLKKLKQNVIKSINKQSSITYLEDDLVSIVVHLAEIVEKQDNEIVELRKLVKSLETKLGALKDKY